MKLKISFIEPHLKLYGGIRRIVELANRLAARGHDVTIFHSDGSPCEWMKCTAGVKDHEKVLDGDHDVLIFNDPNPVDFSLVKRARARLKVFYVLELYRMDLLKGSPKVYLHKRTLLVKRSLQSPYLKLEFHLAGTLAEGKHEHRFSSADRRDKRRDVSSR